MTFTLLLASESTAARRRVEEKTGVIIPFSDWVSGDFPKGMGVRCDVMMTCVSSPPRKMGGGGQRRDRNYYCLNQDTF